LLGSDAKRNKVVIPHCTSIHVLPSVAEECSGPSYSVVRLCQSLRRNSVNTELAVLKWKEQPSELDFVREFRMGALPKRLGSSRQMYDWLKENSRMVEIFHNHGMWQLNSVYTSYLPNRSCYRIVHSPRGALSEWAMTHGSIFKLPFWHILQKPSLKKIDCFHATAKCELEDIRKLGFKNPVCVLPNGIDVPEKSRERVDTKTLLYLGRIHPKKGLENLLTAWEKVQSEFVDWQLQIVGDDFGYDKRSDYLHKLKSFAGGLGCKRIHFVGSRVGKEKENLYEQGSLFVLPTFSENFAMVVAEALSYSLPAIVTKGAPWSGLIENKAGWHIDIGVEPLVVALREAMAMTHQRRVEMGKNGRDWMKRDFSWTRIGQMMAQTYHWLLRPSELEKPSWVHNYHS
jgi:glycosyltransferase involved in cell wall biosynthesis